MKTKMLFSQREEIQLNQDTKIILMKPGQDLYLRTAPKLGKFMQVLFGKKGEDASWVENPKDYEFVNSIIKPVLMYCIRHPDNYKRRLLVEENPAADQEYYDDFNPALDVKLMESQGLLENVDDKTEIFTPQLNLFFIILKKSGWIAMGEEAETAETFPEESSGDKEAPDSSSV